MTSPLEEIAADLPLDPGDQALCSEVDPELFFSKDRHDVTRAKQLCRSCESETKCLVWAVNHPETQGVFGGKTRRQRRKIRKRWRSILGQSKPNDERERAS